MKTTVPLPTTVIEKITNQIQKDYPSLSQEHKTKLFSKTVELWFFIYTEHQKEIQKNSKSFNNDYLYNIYVSIHRKNLSIYKIKINNRIIQYNTLLEILTKSSLVEINSTYSAGRFPKSYRINPSLQYENVQSIELDLTRLIQNNKSREELIQENPEYTKLINDLYLVKINLEDFYTHIDLLVGSIYKIEKGEAKILTPEHSYELKIRAIKINLGIHFFSVACTGRIYSSLANLPKVIIPFITLNGETPKEIDAKNCQPLLLASIIDNPKFKKDCESGIFYDVMSEHLNISRDEFKLRSYAKIFFNNKHINKQMSKSLDEVYPNLSSQINQFKAKTDKEAEEMNKKDLLWHKLQSLEASIFVKIALQQMKPVITRHDSIICMSDDLEIISKEIRKEFKKHSINVTLK